MTVSILSLLINFLLATVSLILGGLLCQDAPSVMGFKNRLLDFSRALISKDILIHHGIFGAFFIVLGLAGLMNFVAILAKGHGFWMR